MPLGLEPLWPAQTCFRLSRAPLELPEPPPLGQGAAVARCSVQWLQWATLELRQTPLAAHVRTTVRSSVPLPPPGPSAPLEPSAVLWQRG